MPTYETEFVYVLRNPGIPDFVKIGFTTRLPEDRVPELQTAVPYPFEVAFRAITQHARRVEQAVHRLLAAERVTPNREFFRTSVDVAANAIRRCQANVTGIDTWEPMPTIHRLRAGDRLALPLRATDTFVLIACKEIFSEPEVLDLWQAHADNDLLEIYVSDDPGHVAGFSDRDPGGDDDPVPFLDRDSTAPNGLLIGRERLVAGDRLVWLSDTAGGPTDCTCVVFEVDGFAQVICRTWSPQVSEWNPLGLPFLLNDFVRKPTPAMVKAAQQVLAVRKPNTWAPRNPDPADGWAEPASHVQPPEFWLRQLRPRRRGC